MKYIDADLLRKELERRIADNTFGAKLELIDILAWLDSLQQEQQEVNLEKEITRFLSYATRMNKGEWRGKYTIGEIGFRAVAHHFYELGKNSK